MVFSSVHAAVSVPAEFEFVRVDNNVVFGAEFQVVPGVVEGFFD